MLWTVFKLFVVAWMLQTVLRFGGSAIYVVLVVSLTLLLPLVIIRRAFMRSGRLRRSTKTGRFNSTVAEQFAGASKIRSPFHRNI